MVEDRKIIEKEPAKEHQQFNFRKIDGDRRDKNLSAEADKMISKPVSLGESQILSGRVFYPPFKI